MSDRSRASIPFALASTAVLSACGLAVPDIKEPWDGKEGTRQIEYEIKRRIYCDVKRGVTSANVKYSLQTLNRTTGKTTIRPFIPPNWGVQISLLLQAEEAGSLNPSVVFNNVLPDAITKFPDGSSVRSGQSSALAFGGTLSSNVTRIDKFNPYYTVGFLMKEETKDSPCLPENNVFAGEHPATSSPLIVSDLGIQQWLEDAMFTNRLLPSVNSAGLPGATVPDTISLQLKFVVVSSGSFTPSWRLVRLSANTGSLPLLAGGRTRTHDLLITIGPNDRQTNDSHLAAQIGQAVTSGSRNLLPIQ